MKNTLYLVEMGMDDNKITTDVKNHRVRVIDRIDIVYGGKEYNMFFEFMTGRHWHYRHENLRTGAPLKHPVYTVDVEQGLWIETDYEEVVNICADGTRLCNSYRNSELEKEFHSKHYEYTRENILKVVNKYKVGAPFTEVKLVHETARDIIHKIGGWRELDILGDNRDFYTEGDSYFSIGDTWNEDHKIVTCNKRTWEACDAHSRRLVVTDKCDVDLVTGRITG